MDLNLIKKPVITEKSTANAQFNKYIFEVTKAANKSEIKATIEDVYKVKVEKLNSVIVKKSQKSLRVKEVPDQSKKELLLLLKKVTQLI